MNLYLQFSATIALIFLLYFISRQSINILNQFLQRNLKSKRLIYSILAIIYLPGTILHELSHLLMANILFLKVQEISIFPETQGDQLKLGKVVFEKKDFIRSIMVGIAPIFMGLGFLLWFSQLQAGSEGGMIFKLMIFYLIFVVSTSMFSSKQDLMDLIYIVPVVIILVGIVYLFNIDLRFLHPIIEALEGGLKFLYALNNYLLLSILIHILFLLVVKIYLYFFK